MSLDDGNSPGFAALDSVIAAGLTSLLAVALVSVVSQSGELTRRGATQLQALAWAQVVLETAPRAQHAREVRSGTTPDAKYDWELTLELSDGQAFERAYVVVNARERPFQVELSTRRLANRRLHDP